MALVALEPLREMATLQNEMNRLFGTFFDTPAGGGTVPSGTAVRRWLPAMDLVETDDHFVLRADLPGLDEDDVRVELEDNVLTVAGERRADHEEKAEGFFRVERASGTFSRSLTLPEGIDPEAISATFDKGVLEVRIAKPEERKPRRVAIKVGDTPAAIEGSES
jgi:HSP20 family protein